MRRMLLWTCLILMGAGVLAPAIVYLPIDTMPGDVVVNRPDFHIFIPLTTSISASVVLTLLFWYFRK